VEEAQKLKEACFHMKKVLGVLGSLLTVILAGGAGWGMR
jgi:hypothetical protein